MTIDNMLEALQDAKKELGGEKTIVINFEWNGNGAFLELEELVYSKVLGLRCIVKAPWWAYGKERE